MIRKLLVLNAILALRMLGTLAFGFPDYSRVRPQDIPAEFRGQFEDPTCPECIQHRLQNDPALARRIAGANPAFASLVGLSSGNGNFDNSNGERDDDPVVPGPRGPSGPAGLTGTRRPNCPTCPGGGGFRVQVPPPPGGTFNAEDGGGSCPSCGGGNAMSATGGGGSCPSCGKKKGMLGGMGAAGPEILLPALALLVLSKRRGARVPVLAPAARKRKKRSDERR